MHVWEGIKCHGRRSREPEGVGGILQNHSGSSWRKYERGQQRFPYDTSMWITEKCYFLNTVTEMYILLKKNALLFFHNKYTNVRVNVNGCEWVCVAGDLSSCVYVCVFECLRQCVWCACGYVIVCMWMSMSMCEREVSLTLEWSPSDGCLVCSRPCKTISGSSKRWVKERWEEQTRNHVIPKITEDGLC